MARKAEVRYVNFYMAGSEALKFDPKPMVQQPKQEVKMPRPRRQKKIVLHVDPIAVAGIAVAFVMLIMMVVGMFQLGAAQKDAKRMGAYVEQLRAENAQLEQEYRAGYDPEEIRQIASAMGMIPKEEAQHIEITVEVPPVEKEATAWESFCTFLADLFA